jgi:hypothetical protein
VGSPSGVAQWVALAKLMLTHIYQLKTHRLLAGCRKSRFVNCGGSLVTRSVSEGPSYGVDLTMQKGPSLTLRVMKNQAKRRPDRFKATNSATSKLTLRVTFFSSLLALQLWQSCGAMASDSLGCQSQVRTQRNELVAERRQGVGLTLPREIAHGYHYAHNHVIVNQV